MAQIKKYKPIGGITAAELFTVGDKVGAEELIAGQGVAVALVDDGSKYEEVASADATPVSVQHTLTLCSDRQLAAAWFDKGFLQHAATEGLAARVSLATGEELLLGYSERFGFEQALRLKSLSFSSGSSPNDSPRVVLTLAACDTDSAIK